MRTASFIFVLSTLICWASPVEAQSASVRYTYSPYAELEGPLPWPLQIRTLGLEVQAGYTLRLRGGGTTLQLSLSYGALFFEYRRGDTFTPVQLPTDQVHVLRHSLMLQHHLTERWSVLASVAPGYTDDLKGAPSVDAFNTTLVAAAIYTFSGGSWIGLGVALDYNFGAPNVLPVAGFHWKILEGLTASGLVPVNADLTYLAARWLGLRLAFSFQGNRYHGNPALYPGASNPALNYSVGQVDLGARLFLGGGLHLSLRGGYSFFRRFEFSDGAEVVSTFSAGNGPVVGVELGIGG
jgi:hypothetical protein